MSEYPRDRFDDIPEYTDRKGGHRAHFDPPVETAGLRWIAAAAALALAVGAFSFFILPGLLNSSASASASASAPAQESTASAPATTPTEQSASPASSSSTSTSAPDEEPTDSAEPTQTATPEDRNSTVEVYNAARVGGLAGSTADELRTAGFTVSGVGDWQGFSVPQSAVYYSRGEQTAQAVGAQLGLPAVYDTRVPGIVVVLTSGG